MDEIGESGLQGLDLKWCLAVQRLSKWKEGRSRLPELDFVGFYARTMSCQSSTPCLILGMDTTHKNTNLPFSSVSLHRTDREELKPLWRSNLRDDIHRYNILSERGFVLCNLHLSRGGYDSLREQIEVVGLTRFSSVGRDSFAVCSHAETPRMHERIVPSEGGCTNSEHLNPYQDRDMTKFD